MEAGGGGHWGSWALIAQKALSALLLPQALLWLPGACVSNIRVTLAGAGLHTREPLLWQMYHEEGGLYFNELLGFWQETFSTSSKRGLRKDECQDV